MVFKRITQTISYLPFFVSWVIDAGIWYELFSTDGGLTQQFNLGIIEALIFWWGNPEYILVIS